MRKPDTPLPPASFNFHLLISGNPDDNEATLPQHWVLGGVLAHVAWVALAGPSWLGRLLALWSSGGFFAVAFFVKCAAPQATLHLERSHWSFKNGTCTVRRAYRVGKGETRGPLL